MKHLFDSKFAPLTDCMGFVNVDIDTALKEYLDWCMPLMKRNGNDIKTIEWYNSFTFSLLELMPFNFPEKILLFSTDSSWTGYLENVTRTETGRIKRISEPLNCKSIEVGVWPSKSGKVINNWGGGFFSLNQGNELIRLMMLSRQDRGWEFDNYGEYLPFEEVEKYNEKLARNRFTPEMLDRYLKHYGIDFFNEEFYMPPGSKAYIIEIVRPPYPNEVSETLEEVRKKLRYG